VNKNNALYYFVRSICSPFKETGNKIAWMHTLMKCATAPVVIFPANAKVLYTNAMERTPLKTQTTSHSCS